jgi:hypothetical protein
MVVFISAFLCGAPAYVQVAADQSSVDSFLPVDCLLPGQTRRIGGRFVFIGPRRPAKTAASECAIRGGEYTEYDRADYRTATAIWLSQANGGDAIAQSYLGEIYEKGLGTEPDYVEARRWYQLAADQGNTSAQFNLGKLYEAGLGVPVDREQALYWYRRATGLPELEATPSLEPAPAEPADDDSADTPAIEMIDPLVPDTRGITVTPVAAEISERLIVGRVRSNSGIRSLTVNDADVSVESSGIFQTRVAVERTGSRISIVAVDSAGRRGSRVFMLQPAGVEPPPVEASFGRYHALVIGNNNYEFMNPLATARNDARVIGRLLEERYGFIVTRLEDATRNEIMTALNTLRQTLTEEDNLLIYYAGHGTLDEANDRGHWQPVDAKPEDTTAWLSNTSLTDLLTIMAARHVLVIADSCYSGALTRSSATSLRSGQTAAQRAADVIALNKKRSRTALASGGLAPVLDMGRGGHSVFAGALIDALNSNVDVLDGQRLMLQIRAHVAQAAYDRDRFEQVPVYAPINLAGHEFGEFFFVPKRAETVADISNTTPGIN